MILLLIKREGFPAIRMKLIEGRYCDRTIQNALRDGAAPEAEFVAALERIISDLDYATQGLLKRD